MHTVHQYPNTPTKDPIENQFLKQGRIRRALKQMPWDNKGRVLDFGIDQLLTLRWHAPNYATHNKHRLNQIIRQSFEIFYP